MLGIGGGGDVVGALAVARLCEALGHPVRARRRRLGAAADRPATRGRARSSQIHGGDPLGERAVLAGAETSTAEGVRVLRVARWRAHLGSRDRADRRHRRRRRAPPRAIARRRGQLGCDLVDLRRRRRRRDRRPASEPGLGSPLCDAVMLAAGAAARRPRSTALMAVIGAGCDGELTRRRGARAGRGAGRGRRLARQPRASTPRVADELERAARVAGTEASMQVVRCARGETGEAEIRGGRRRVPLGPVGALAFFFDLEAAARRAAAGRGRRAAPTTSRRRATALDALGVTHRARLRARARRAAGRLSEPAHRRAAGDAAAARHRVTHIRGYSPEKSPSRLTHVHTSAPRRTGVRPKVDQPETSPLSSQPTVPRPTPSRRHRTDLRLAPAIRERPDSRCGRAASRGRSPRGGRGARCDR